MSDKKLLFELHGLEIMSDTMYIVADKIDYSAPSGFQEAGVTKLPSDGVGHTFHAPYKRTSKFDGVWNTGFYELSPCYQGVSRDKVKIIVKNLMANVVMPYRAAIGKADALNEHNHDFFDKYNWTVQVGDIYRTENPLDVVALYMALIQREVMPKAKKGDSAFAETPYVVVDVSEKTKKSEEKANKEFEAIGMFEILYKQERARLDLILYYIGGATFTADTSQAAYRSLFKNYLAALPTNIEMFMGFVEKTDKEKGLAELNIYKKLKVRHINDPKIRKTAAGMIYYDQTELGSSLKNAAEAVAKDPSMSEIKKEILFEED